MAVRDEYNYLTIHLGAFVSSPTVGMNPFNENNFVHHCVVRTTSYADHYVRA